MEEIILNAMERNEKPKKARRDGFVPGVLNGPGANSTSVKFQSAELDRVIAKHGTNAKVWIKLGDEKKYGFIKELQRHPIEEKIMHIAIQLVEKDQKVKRLLPITFNGQTELEHKLMMLQILKPDVEVEGVATLIPNEVTVDVARKKFNDDITSADFNIPAEVKILDPQGEVYAVVKNAKGEIAINSDEAEAKTAEA
jgi:large subunit ribosomal protein L25